MDYYKIGERIRKYRKDRNMSQEELAEQVGISVTHMSHIETGNTKLSLPVFVDIANVLQIQTDSLLKDELHGKAAITNELSDMLNNCDIQKAKLILEIAKSAKFAIDKHMKL